MLAYQKLVARFGRLLGASLTLPGVGTADAAPRRRAMAAVNLNMAPFCGVSGIGLRQRLHRSGEFLEVEMKNLHMVTF
jgi:hypothetical protein